MADATEPFLPFSRPSITDRERAAVLETLDSGWLTTGPRVRQFEAEFGTFVGAEQAVAVNSATAGLHLALEAIGVRAGDEVVVPTWTFASTAAVAIWLGARPVLVDIEPESLNASPEAVMAAVTPRTKAIIVVHMAGRPAAIEAIVAAAADRGLAVVEDAAHAFPSPVAPDGRFAGTFGRAGVFSFYATKTITTGEGGMLVTADPDLANRARSMSLHGITRSAWNRYSATGSWFYEIEDAGFKDNMTDLAASLGLVQLSRAHELRRARLDLVAAYRERIAASPARELVTLPPDDPSGAHAWHLFIVRLALDRLRVDRGQVIESMRELGVGTSVHFIPLHLHPLYRNRYGYEPQDLPIAAAEFERVLSLPLWPGMALTDVDRVVGALERSLLPNVRGATRSLEPAG